MDTITELMQLGRLRAALFLARSGALILCVAGLAACGQADMADQLEDYNQRLARVLEASIEPVEAPPLPVWPRRSAHPQRPAALNLALRDTRLLLSCGMANRLAERNSTLARVQDASQRLHAEHALLEALRACRDELESAPQRAQLTDLIALKSAQWPLWRYHAGLGSTEVAQFFGYSVRGRGDWAAGRQALESLVALDLAALNGAPAEPAAWSRILHPLSQTGAAGRILQAQRDLIVGFKQGNRLLTSPKATPAQCAQGALPPHMRILRTVFQKYYLGQIQPAWGELVREKAAIADVFERVRQQHAALDNPALDAYWAAGWAPGNPLDAELDAVASLHVERWQQIWRHCDVLPAQLARD